MSDKKEKELPVEKVKPQSNYVMIVNGNIELKVHKKTLKSWLKNGYKEK